MNAADLLAALDLPTSSRVDRRVPKTLLMENGAPTAADKRRLNEGIEECRWVATLKPTTIAVPEYRDDAREYLEINVLWLRLRAGARTARLVELVHRAVPYPVLLVTESASAGLSLAHKRWSQNEAGTVVLDGAIEGVTWDAASDVAYEAAILEALALGRQPRHTLYALYQGWIDTLLALQAARRTGSFVVRGSREQASARSEALQECSRLDAAAARLRKAAARERQLSGQVALNLDLKRIEAALAAAREQL